MCALGGGRGDLGRDEGSGSSRKSCEDNVFGEVMMGEVFASSLETKLETLALCDWRLQSAGPYSRGRQATAARLWVEVCWWRHADALACAAC